MDLLKGADLNVRLFALPDGIPPKDWQFQTYLTVSPAERLDPGIRYRVYPPPFPFAKANRAWNLLADRLNFPITIEKSLAKVIRQWKPDVIHTLGFDPASFFYLNVREDFNVQNIGKWVAQARGGPDFMLNQYMPDIMEKIRRVLKECDKLIADNQPNYDFALENGLDTSKLSSLGVVSGTGGMDVEKLSIAGYVCEPGDLPARKQYFQSAILSSPIRYLTEYRRSRLLNVMLPVFFPFLQKAIYKFKKIKRQLIHGNPSL